jgi:hypothetical protein
VEKAYAMTVVKKESDFCHVSITKKAGMDRLSKIKLRYHFFMLSTKTHPSNTGVDVSNEVPVIRHRSFPNPDGTVLFRYAGKVLFP